MCRALETVAQNWRESKDIYRERSKLRVERLLVELNSDVGKAEELSKLQDPSPVSGDIAFQCSQHCHPNFSVLDWELHFSIHRHKVSV